jgi:hypothetical protein
MEADAFLRLSPAVGSLVAWSWVAVLPGFVVVLAKAVRAGSWSGGHDLKSLRKADKIHLHKGFAEMVFHNLHAWSRRKGRVAAPAIMKASSKCARRPWSQVSSRGLAAVAAGAAPATPDKMIPRKGGSSHTDQEITPLRQHAGDEESRRNELAARITPA